MFTPYHLRRVILTLAILLLLNSNAEASEHKFMLEIDIKHQIISANFQGIELKDVVENIFQNTGIFVEVPKALLGYRMSACFKNQDLSEALNRLLGHFNRYAIYNQSGQFIAIKIVGVIDRQINQKEPGINSELAVVFPVDEGFEIEYNTVPPEGYISEVSPDTTIVADLPPPLDETVPMVDTEVLKGVSVPMSSIIPDPIDTKVMHNAPTP